MAELPTKIQLLDTAELCLRAGQLLTRLPEDAEAAQAAAAPITAWAASASDPADAEARRKAVKLVLAGMGRTLGTPPGSRVRDAEEFVAAAEAWRHTLLGVPGYGAAAGGGPGTGTGAGVTFSGGRLMLLVRNLIVAAVAGDPEARDRLIAGAVRCGRTDAQPPTSGEYAAALAFLFRHDRRLPEPVTLPGPPPPYLAAPPEPVLPGTPWHEPMGAAPPSGPEPLADWERDLLERQSGTRPEPEGEGLGAGHREPPTGPQRNLGAYPGGNAEDGGGAP
jgi:hypothetical protein